MAMALGAGTPNPQPNVTPLIDVLLTLLVIFMVITPVAPKGETALIPQPEASAVRPPPVHTVVVQLVLGVNGEAELRINQESVAWAGLQQRLLDIYKLRAEKVLFVAAEDRVVWSDVAQVVGTAHAAGVDRVALMPNPAKGS